MNIKTWKERWRNPWLYKRDAMQAEIDELRAEIKRLTGIAFLASAERDELRMELGDLPEAQADMLATIKVQREVLEQALEALQTCRIRSVTEGEVREVTPKIITNAIIAIQEQLK